MNPTHMPNKTLSKGGGFSCESPRLSLTFCLLHCFQKDAKALFESLVALLLGAADSYVRHATMTPPHSG